MFPFAFLKLISPKVVIFLAIIFLAATSLWMYGNWKFEQGASVVQKKWDRERQEMISAHASALAQRAEENAKLAEQHHKQLLKMKKGYANEIAEIKRNADEHSNVSLRLPSSVCDAGPAGKADSQSASGGESGAPRTIVLPKGITEDLRSLVKRADEIVAGCRLDQAFIDENKLRESK